MAYYYPQPNPIASFNQSLIGLIGLKQQQQELTQREERYQGERAFEREKFEANLPIRTMQAGTALMGQETARMGARTESAKEKRLLEAHEQGKLPHLKTYGDMQSQVKVAEMKRSLGEAASTIEPMINALNRQKGKNMGEVAMYVLTEEFQTVKQESLKKFDSFVEMKLKTDPGWFKTPEASIAEEHMAMLLKDKDGTMFQKATFGATMQSMKDVAEVVELNKLKLIKEGQPKPSLTFEQQLELKRMGPEKVTKPTLVKGPEGTWIEKRLGERVAPTKPGWQRKTRSFIDNGQMMKQDYDYNPKTRKEVKAGKPYKARDLGGALMQWLQGNDPKGIF